MEMRYRIRELLAFLIVGCFCRCEAKDAFVYIKSFGSDRIEASLKCKKSEENGDVLAGYGVVGAYGVPNKSVSYKKLLAVLFKKGGGKIPEKLLTDLLNPGAISISDKPGTIEGYKVDWILTIAGGDGGETYFAKFGFVAGRVKIRAIFGETDGPPLSASIETTIFHPMERGE